MKQIIIVVAIGLASFVTKTYADVGPESQQCMAPEKYTTIDLDASRPSLVTASVNGRPSTLTLNLAAGFSIVFRRAAKELNLPVHNLPPSSDMYDNGVRITDYAEIESLVVGGANFGKVRLLVIDRDPGTELAGGIGVDVFSNVDFELDMAHRKLSLFSQNHCRGKVVYWTDKYSSQPFTMSARGALHFPMEVDGKRVEASLAPGSSVSQMRADAISALFEPNSLPHDVDRTRGNDPGRSAGDFRSMRITALGLTIPNTRVRLTQPNDQCELNVGREGQSATYGTDCDGIYPLTIGRNVLENMRIYFATQEKMMYFTAADATM